MTSGYGAKYRDRVVLASPYALMAMLEDARERGMEGLVVKAAGSAYKLAERG